MSGLPDHGGQLDGDHVAGLTIQQIHCYTANQPQPLWWHGYDPAGGAPIVQRFVGYLRPGAPYPPGARVEDAAFEIFAPLARDASRPLVVVIGAWSTFGAPLDAPLSTSPLVQNLVPDRFKYPGHRRADGLVMSSEAAPNAIARPGPDLVNLVAQPPAGYQVIGAYIVPRTAGRPMVFEMQRYVQLAKAIDLVFAQPGGSPYLPEGFATIGTAMPKLIAGGSFGGLTSQAAVLRHPELFHGAGNGAFSGSVRRTMGEQFAWNLVGRRSGMGLDESSLSILDTLEWGSWYRQVGWDYFNGSSSLRRRLGQQFRPIASLIGDEDTVTCGADWIPLLHGARGYVASGTAAASGTPGLGNAEHHWTLVDRRCHAEGGEFINPLTGAPSSFPPDLERAFVPFVHQHWLATQSVTVQAPAVVADDGSEDPYDALLARGIPASPPPSSLLQLDPAFGAGGRTVGHGLCLGADESLKSAVVDGATYVYAGDADGVVHRFALDAVTQSFVEQARSPSLGNGAFALEVAALDGSSSPVVVVGTHKHLFQLDALTLQPIPGRYRYLAEFERTRPRRIAVAELHAGAAGKEIVLTSFQGQLLVMDKLFNVLTDMGEPGIQDFVVHEDQSYGSFATTSSAIPVTLLSQRGHLVNVTLNDQAAQPNAPPAELHCWTPGQRGAPGDLELVPGPGGKQVVASFGADAYFDAPIRHFDAFTLGAGSTGNLGLQPNSRRIEGILDLEAVHDANGSVLGYVLLEGQWIRWIPITGPDRASFLSWFSPAHRAIALEAVDLVTSQPGEPVEELVLSTLTGHLVWFRVGDLQSSLFGVARTLPSANPHAHTNHSLAGTWGLVSRMKVISEAEEMISYFLYGITQAGELYEVDPRSGASTLLHDVRELTEDPTGLYGAFAPMSPIRDMAFLDESLSGVSGAMPELSWRTGSGLFNPQPGAWLHPVPWQNGSSEYLHPAWYKFPNLTPQGTFEHEPAPKLPIYDGFAPFSGGGAVGGWAQGDPYAGVRDFHWWAGSPLAYPNLVQGAYATSTQVLGNWYSTEDTGSSPNYGSTAVHCKDLRNMVKDAYGSTYGMQSLRVTRDGQGRLIVIGTSGGGIALLRPQGPSHTQHGQILWSSEEQLPGSSSPTDDGYGTAALAVRRVPGSPSQVDIFYGVCFGHPDPLQVPPAGNASHVSSVIRWLRWNPNGTPQMSGISKLHLDPSSANPRGGFGVAGMALGDILQSSAHPGEELVVTTLDGDLFVFDISGGTINPIPLLHTWVPAALGAYNGIVIDDLDMDLKKELYVASSQGIWKWRQP